MGLLITAAGRRIALAVAVIAIAGCGGPPCDEDPLGCGDGTDEFAVDPACDLTGPLAIELGDGDEDFLAYAAGQEPTVHEGAQGGHHLCLGIRIHQPALEYPLLRVVFDADFDDPLRCADDPACDPWVNTAHRELTLGPDLPLNGDSVEETGFILILSLWPEELERRLRLEITDECGRVGTAEHDMSAAAG